MHVTHPTNLVTSESLVGAAAGDVSENLWAADGLLELLALARGRRVLPDRAALESESGWCELLGEALGWVEVGQKALCISRPVDGTVLL